MCKVIVKNPKENIGFVLFNHIFARESDDFTIDDLMEELDNFYTRDELRKGINLLFEDGVISHRVGYYQRLRGSVM